MQSTMVLIFYKLAITSKYHVNPSLTKFYRHMDGIRHLRSIRDDTYIVPNSTKSVDKLQLLKGPMEGCADHKSLERKIGLSYQQVLGELIYAYIVCQLDIGYAVVLLSCFATTPAREHYLMLKGICKYLCIQYIGG